MMKIRQPGKRDKEKVMKLVKGLYAKRSKEVIHSWEMGYGNYLAHTYVVDIDGNLVGYIALGGDLDSLLIGDLYVLPKYREKGIGSALIQKAVQQQIKRNKKFIKVNILKRNRKFYEKLGFTYEGKTNAGLLKMAR